MIQFDNAAQWADQVAASGKITEGPVGVGTRLTEQVKTGPFSEELTWEITAFEPNQLVRFEADNTLGKTQVSYMFETDESGTKLAAEVSIQLKGFYRYARPVVQYLHRRNREGYLAKIKRVLEDQ
jgi:hypothetical protein